MFPIIRCDVLTVTSLATQARVAKQQQNVTGVGRINIKSSVMVPRYAQTACPHAASAKDCPVWKKKEIQRIRVERRISFPEARRLVESKSPSTGFTSSLSFADTVNRKIWIKSVVCQTDLT